ncbi:MAG: Dabb family protein [Fibrobacteraceae bacterium]|jgi:hypothetical protein|nr:Dabb family protein [Fibrobacteraceae bacterium]
MIRHLVFWKLKESANNASAKENAEKLVELFKSLEGKIPELVSIESGYNFNDSAAAWDFALSTSFKSKEDLDAYQVHPEHQKIVAFVKSIVSDRCVVDYEF